LFFLEKLERARRIERPTLTLAKCSEALSNFLRPTCVLHKSLILCGFLILNYSLDSD
jgi:hypothetical protein